MVTPSPALVPLGAHTQLVQTRHGWMLANPNDFYLGRALIEYGECSELESAVLRQLLVQPGIVVEVGANIGVHTIMLAREAQARRQVLVAFEPQPVIFQNLCANLAANGVRNVLAWPYACGAAPGRCISRNRTTMRWATLAACRCRPRPQRTRSRFRACGWTMRCAHIPWGC
ncbi:FkbM family methyltransferase [Paraburkholderia aspalathi]